MGTLEMYFRDVVDEVDKIHYYGQELKAGIKNCKLVSGPYGAPIDNIYKLQNMIKRYS